MKEERKKGKCEWISAEIPIVLCFNFDQAGTWKMWMDIC
jgi:hypothetical protein